MDKVSWDEYTEAVGGKKAFRLENLESMIDSQGLKGLLDKIIEVCGEKAEHIRSSYDDNTTANSWEKDGRALESVRSKLTN
jgi:hypothetical protein